MTKADIKSIRIRQVKSAIGTKPGQRATLKSLGLRRIRHEVVQVDSPTVRGMLKKVEHLVTVVD